MARPPLIWITRTEPQASVTASRLEARGLTALVDPLLAVERLSPDIEASAFTHLIVTSLNGLEAFCAQHPQRHHTVWAVGDATAEAAHTAGFAQVHSASGNVEDLCALVSARAPEEPLLWLKPETAARDLITALPGRNLTAACYYRTVIREAGVARARLSDITHILLYSPRAAQACAPYLAGETATVLCLSEAVAVRLREHLNFAGNLPPVGLNIEVAASPDEEALLRRL